MSDDHLKKQIAKAIEQRRGTGTVIGSTYVPGEDIHRVKGQNFSVISYCCPEGTRVRTTNGIAIKLSGSFGTEEEANKHAEIIRNEDPHFDVSVVSNHIWGTIPMPESERKFVDSRYANELVSRTIRGLHDSLVRGQRNVEERKQADFKKAEEEMKKIKGDDYKMPEKSAQLEQLEKEISEKKETIELGVMVDLIMEYCKTPDCPINFDIATGLIRYINKRSVEIAAQLERAEKDKLYLEKDKDSQK